MADSGRDTKLYPYADPFHGERGPKFERKFEPEFLSGVARVTDKFSNLKLHILGQDVGGVRPTSQAQLAVNPAHINGVRAHPGAPNSAERRESQTAFEVPVLGEGLL